MLVDPYHGRFLHIPSELTSCNSEVAIRLALRLTVLVCWVSRDRSCVILHLEVSEFHHMKVFDDEVETAMILTMQRFIE